MKMWIADESTGLLFYSHGTVRKVCSQPLGLCLCASMLICAQPQQALACAADSGNVLASYPLPPNTRRMCALPDALYCLSGDADSISLLCPRTGRLRLCAQAGCYPRDVALSPCRRMLAVAGGAAGAVLIYHAEDLHLIRALSLPGIVSAVTFAGAELVALCAVEDTQPRSRLYRISVHGVASEMGCWDGLPGALLALPDNSLLCGVMGKLLRLRADGRVVHCLPCALPDCLRPCPAGCLCVDALDGCVLRFSADAAHAQRLYRGSAPCDALLV